MMKITQILSFIVILVASFALAERSLETCITKDAQGNCVEKQYLETGVEMCLAKDQAGTCIAKQNAEDYFMVKECTAPKKGTCTASISLGDKTAKCEVSNGNTCTAKAKMPPFVLQMLGIKK